MSSVYEEYMRNVLGYEPIRYRDTYDAEYNDYMNYSNFNMPQQIESNLETSRLESCYPDIYNLVYPMVKKACSQNNRALSSDLVDELTNEIYNAIEDDKLNENRTSEIKNRSIDVKTSSKSIETKTNLSRQENVSNEDKTPVILEVAGVGQYSISIGGQRQEGLNEEMVTQLSKQEFDKDNNTMFLVGGAKDVPYEEVIKALNLLHLAGIKSVGLMTNPI